MRKLISLSLVAGLALALALALVLLGARLLGGPTETAQADPALAVGAVTPWDGLSAGPSATAAGGGRARGSAAARTP